jgi:hypothetical protein
MSQSTGFAIMRANQEVIYFDAITNLTETYSGSVTKHPMSNGSLITDHTIIENPRFTVSGVLSDADFNLARPTFTDTDISSNKQYINNTATAYPVQISEMTSINKILPEVVAQFTRDTIPEVYVAEQPKAKSSRAVKQNLIEMWRNREKFTFFEFSDGIRPNIYPNCVFTNVGFKEDESTGEGVFPDLAFEQVTFAETKSISVQINKGRVNAKTRTKPVTDANPATAPSNYSKQSVLEYQKPTQ